MSRLLAEQTGLRRLPIARTSEVGQDDFLTNFERKARLQGKMIYRARFER